MPFGPQPAGFAYFVGAKYLGYSLYCGFASRRIAVKQSLPRTDLPSLWGAGAVRTLIGVAVGAVVGLSFWKIPYFAAHDTVDSVLFFTLLIPVRVGEWWLLFRTMYPRSIPGAHSYGWLIALGIVVSFVLDALALLTALVLPGGMWVC